MTTLGQTGLDKKGMSLHSLRYIHATWFLSEGDTLDRMAHRLGHFSTDITYKHYRLFIEKDHDATRVRMAKTEVKR